jgi:RNA polymerase sigma-70 factor (ECF subfamily)
LDVEMLDKRDRAFEALYREHYAAVYRYVLVAAGPDEAEDLVAESFHKAYFALRDGGASVHNPRAWLLTIARRTVIDGRRRTGRRPTASLGKHDPAAPDLLRARETWIWFDSVTRDLPEHARQALYMRYAGGLAAEEIGAALGLTASGVRTAISRALEGIRRREEEANR